MRRGNVVAALMVLAGALLPAHSSAQNPGPPAVKQAPTASEAAALALERRFEEAVKASDAAAMIDLGWLGATYFDGGGPRQITQQFNSDWAKSCRTSSLSMADAKATSPVPGVVVVTSRITIDQTCGGQKTPSPLLLMSVYARSKKGWRPVALSQIAPSPPAGGAPPPAEQTVAGLRSQWAALFLGSLANARARGQGAAEYGAALGKLYAPTWSPTLTPQEMARSVRASLALLGVDAQLIEDTPDRAVLRLGRPDSARFGGQFAATGVTPAEWVEAWRAFCEQIAAPHGLAWDQRPDGDGFIATVTRRQ